MPPYVPINPENAKRATITEYVNYMERNPFYFEQLFRKPFSREQAAAEFLAMDKHGLVAISASPSCMIAPLDVCTCRNTVRSPGIRKATREEKAYYERIVTDRYRQVRESDGKRRKRRKKGGVVVYEEAEALLAADEEAGIDADAIDAMDAMDAMDDTDNLVSLDGIAYTYYVPEE